MMKRLLSSIALCVLCLSMSVAQVVDAFQGILPVTDPTMKKSLNGEWRLKVVDGIDDQAAVPAEDESWGHIPVPGCWEAYGFCKSSYDKALPLTGYYRTSFNVPEAWRGMRIVLRFDGVLYGYDLWVNDRKAGQWRSGYNTALFDITDCLTPPLTPPLKGAGSSAGRASSLKGAGSAYGREQQLAMRVISQFPGSDFDYNDDWAPNGIFRDVTLMAVPKTHLADLTILTKNTGEVSVETKLANPGKGLELKHEVIDAQGCLVANYCETVKKSSSSAKLSLSSPQLWTAETPYLYKLRTTLLEKGRPIQTFEHRFGFRELTIDGNVLKLNGLPIKLRGVTSHSTDPRTVKVVSDDLTLLDMKLMKEASVNYIRTSHYPREPRFYELADSLGFYVIDEVPFGYGDRNLSKKEFYPVLQQRAQATIRRDKNHPSVLIWSLGNENPLTDICIRLGDYVKTRLDPSRPYCYPQVGSYFRRFFEGKEARGFPSPAPIYTPHYPTTGQIAGFYQHRDRPVIFTEYCHTLGISFEDHDRQWEIIERTPGIAGGSVWEWVDQGMPFRSEGSSSLKYGYEEKVYTTDSSGFEMCGNKGTDGLLYADRTPLPNYYELQHNYARAFVRRADPADGGLRLTICNRYDFINLKDCVTFRWTLTADRDTVGRGAFSPVCAPRDSAVYHLALPAMTAPGRLTLLHFEIADDQSHTFLRQTFTLLKPEMAWTGSGDPTELVEQGPMLRVGRKPTMAERLKLKGQRIERYLQPLANPYVKADVSTRQTGTAIEVNYTLTPDTTDIVLTELGVAFLVRSGIDRVQWIGLGPFASYPGRRQACRYGFWAKHQDDLYFEGNHMGVDVALLTDKDGEGILIAGDSLKLNFEQTDRGIVVTVNAAVSGQGPKFARTAFPVVSRSAGVLTGSFRLYRVSPGSSVWRYFCPPQQVPAPFRPFKTQYDTYLMRFSDVAAE